MTPERIIGRYAVYGEIASGGMATVHLGRLLGQVGFARTVAVKRMHPQFAKDPEFISMFLDEARLAGRIQHPNAVSILDVVATDPELFLVMEYVHGESLSRLLGRARRLEGRMSATIASSIVCGTLHGLHAAHEARTERGEPLEIVHRDVSPHNIMVGLDGLARVLDFGVAKAVGRLQHTRDGQTKGKLPYMAPEQLQGQGVDRRVDVYAAAVVLWEALSGRPLFRGDNEGAVINEVLKGATVPPSVHAPGIPPIVDDIVMRGLSVHPTSRWPTAREFGVALEEAIGVASQRQVGEWVDRLAGDSLANRSRLVEELESVSSDLAVPAGLSSPPPQEQPAPSSPALGSGPAAVVEHDIEDNATTAVSDTALAAAGGVPADPAAASPLASSSQLSSISVSKPGHVGRQESSRTKVVAMVAGLALVGIVVFLAWRVLSDPSGGSSATGADGPGGEGAVVEPSPPAATNPSPELTASSTASATASSSEPDAGQADKPPPPRAPVRWPPRAKPKPTSKSPVRFDQPD